MSLMCCGEKPPIITKVLYEGRLVEATFYQGRGFGQYSKWILRFQDGHIVRMFDDDIPLEGLSLGKVYQIYQRFCGVYPYDLIPKIRIMNKIK